MSAERRLVTAVSIITAAAMAAEGAKAVAQNHEPTPPPTPGITKALPQNFTTPQKALKEMGVTLTPTPEAKREIQLAPNPIEFTYNGQQYEWLRDNARYGIPPNNPNVPTGTIDVKINGNYQYSWQLQQSIYPAENTAEGRSIGIAGQIADTQTGKGFLATIYGTAGGWKLALETMPLDNPRDYSQGAHTLAIKGLEDIVLEEDIIDSFSLSEESGIKYINIKITNAADSTKNGTYRYPRDSQGNVVPPAQKQEEDTPTPTKTPTLTPTLTPTPTPPPTNGTPTIEPIATFDPNRNPDTRIILPISPGRSFH